MDKLSPECIFIMVYLRFFYVMGYPYGSVIKNYPPSAGDTGSISGSGRSPGEGNGTPLQYSSMGNPREEISGQRSLAGYGPGGCKGSAQT